MGDWDYTCEVLIETYWNVNFVAKTLPESALFVLIETYWNVNRLVKTRNGFKVLVLIETYWNVNFEGFIECDIEIPY